MEFVVSPLTIIRKAVPEKVVVVLVVVVLVVLVVKITLYTPPFCCAEFLLTKVVTVDKGANAEAEFDSKRADATANNLIIVVIVVVMVKPTPKLKIVKNMTINANKLLVGFFLGGGGLRTHLPEKRKRYICVDEISRTPPQTGSRRFDRKNALEQCCLSSDGCNSVT